MKMSEYPTGGVINPNSDIIIVQSETEGTVKATVKEILESYGLELDKNFTAVQNGLDFIEIRKKDTNQLICTIDTGYSNSRASIDFYDATISKALTPGSLTSLVNIGREDLPFNIIYTNSVRAGALFINNKPLIALNNIVTPAIRLADLSWNKSSQGLFYSLVSKASINIPSNVAVLQATIASWTALSTANLFMFKTNSDSSSTTAVEIMANNISIPENATISLNLLCRI